MGKTPKIQWWNTTYRENERNALIGAFDARRMTAGSITLELEALLGEQLEVPHVICTNSGTSALTMALLAIGVTAGDEVIVPAVSWIATAQAAAILGARVIVADTLPNLPILDPAAVTRVVTKHTKAVVPVHMNGREVNIAQLRESIGDKTAIVEDACKATFCQSTQGYLGTQGEVGCFSMGMISLLPIGYGGFCVTSSSDLAARMRTLRWHGTAFRDGLETYEHLSQNFKCTDLLTSLAVSQLAWVHEKIHHLQELYRRYETGLRELEFIQIIPVDLSSGKIPLLIDVRSPLRARICAYLNARGVETCYFHPPLNEAKYLGPQVECPNAKALTEESFHLPSGPGQTFENVDTCLELLRQFRKECL